MDGDVLWLVLLVILSAFFSGSEMAYSSSSKTKLKTLAQDGKRSAKTALGLSEKFDSLLSTLLVGNNIVNIAASSIATVLLTEKLGGKTGPVAATAIMTLVILVFGEITPKVLANDHPEKTAMRYAWILRILNVIFTPINLIFSGWKKLIKFVFHSENDQTITEEELITIIDEAEEVGSLDEQESELIRSAIEFNDANVRDILTPRVDIIAASLDTPVTEIADIFRKQRFSRLPIYRDSIDNIIGILNEKDFNIMVYQKKNDISKILRSAVFVPEKMKTSKLLRTFQKTKVHMAIAVDEFGGTAGVVTLEDVLEGLVGEIWDEHDEVIEDLRRVSDNIYLVSCAASFDSIAESLGITDEENTTSTMGGWVQKQLGKVPEKGDSFTFGDLLVEVTKVAQRRAIEIRVTVCSEPAENTDAD